MKAMQSLTALALVMTATCAAAAQPTAQPVATTASSPAPGAMQTTALPSFDYRYDVSWGDIGVGTLDLKLQPEAGHAGCYRYSTTTHPNALVAMFYGAPGQTSLFCIEDGRIRSQRFVSTLPGSKKQSYTLDFDWARHQVVDNHGKRRTIPDDAVDSLALQQVIRLWVLDHRAELLASKPPIAHFTMVDDKHLTHYRFKFAGQQRIDTPAGSFDTLLMERIDNPHKVGRFWLAPARHYMPVKSETKMGDKPAVTMVLKK